MRRTIFTTLLLVFLFSPASAQESIILTVPQDLAAKACPSPVWKDLNVVWDGVKDKRGSPEVGTQTQKGKNPLPVVLDPPLEEVFNSALKNLLSTCGMNLKGTSEDLHLHIEIRDFYVGVEKTLLTGKAKATSSVLFVATHGGGSKTIGISHEIESKRVRSGNIKQLKSTLDELLTDTLKLIPATEELRELK